VRNLSFLCLLLNFLHRFIWVKPSRNPGVLSTLTYRIMIYESKSNDADSDESTSWIIVIATIVALAGGIAAFWKFGRSTTPEATKNDKIDGRAGFRWLREEGNDLIPISELAARKQFVTSSISGSPACCLIDLSMVGLGRFLKIRR
jgi:hypothetical protein